MDIVGRKSLSFILVEEYFLLCHFKYFEGIFLGLLKSFIGRMIINEGNVIVGVLLVVNGV